MPRHEKHLSEVDRQQVPLGDFPSDVVRLTCSLCSRRGKLSKAKLIAEHGADMGLVNLLNHLSADCPHMRPDPWGNKSCRAHYEGLTQSDVRPRL